MKKNDLSKQKQLFYSNWLACIDQWAEKHGITSEQAINIAFYDHLDGVSMQELFWYHSQMFAEIYKNNKTLLEQQ